MEPEQDSFISYFKHLPKKSETTIRFFNRTDFYTVHGEDTTFVAKEVFKSTSNVKMIGSGNSKIESLNLNKNQFETLIKDLLLVRQYCVEVYCRKNNEWNLEYKGSPGYISQFEDILFGVDTQTGTTSMAIKTSTDNKCKTIGVATLDISERLFSVYQLTYDDNLSQLEGLIVQIGPKEILVPDSNEYKDIIKIGTRCGALITTRKSSEFTNDGLDQDLNRLLEWKPGQVRNSLTLPEMKLTTATQALKCLIKYSELISNEADYEQYSLTSQELKNYVHVDGSSAKALGLITLQEHGTSLIKHLDKCRTSQGHRLLSQWVKKPLRDIRTITDRQEVIGVLTDDTELRISLYEEHLRTYPDLQLLARKLQRKNATMQDCYRIYQAVKKIPRLVEVLRTAEYSAVVKDQFITRLGELKRDMEKYQEMVETTLDMEQVEKGEYVIQSEFSEDLTELRAKLNVLQENMESELNTAARQLSLDVNKTIKLETNNQYGYFFRVTNKKEEKRIRNHPDYKILDSIKSCIRFQSHALAGYNKEYLDARDSYEECQKSIVEEILNIAVGYVSTLLTINTILAKLDVLTGLAVVASNAPIPYVRPSMLESDGDGGRVLQLKQARHPLLEMQDNISYIPNDIMMDRDEHTFFIITGPNMGGKSTYLRTAGVVTLLAHIGSFVPCQEARISIVDAILSRIGAGDCQQTGVSTMMNEMIETSSILQKVTKNSLVLIDELGRGTSTYDGCGLAWAIAKYLAEEVKCFTMFATHFQELTTLPDKVSSAYNCHVTAAITRQEKTGEGDMLTMLYQIEEGPCDRSFGIDVARMVQLKEHVIQVALEKQRELEKRQTLGYVTGQTVTSRELEQGETLIDEFLRNLKSSGVEEFENLKRELLSKNNKYVNSFVAAN